MLVEVIMEVVCELALFCRDEKKNGISLGNVSHNQNLLATSLEKISTFVSFIIYV